MLIDLAGDTRLYWIALEGMYSSAGMVVEAYSQEDAEQLARDRMPHMKVIESDRIELTGEPGVFSMSTATA